MTGFARARRHRVGIAISVLVATFSGTDVSRWDAEVPRTAEPSIRPGLVDGSVGECEDFGRSQYSNSTSSRAHTHSTRHDRKSHASAESSVRTRMSLHARVLSHGFAGLHMHARMWPRGSRKIQT